MAKKITTLIPYDLLQKAQKVTGKGITQTIKAALELLSKRDTYEGVRKFRGKYKSRLSIKNLREDR